MEISYVLFGFADSSGRNLAADVLAGTRGENGTLLHRFDTTHGRYELASMQLLEAIMTILCYW